MSCPLPIVIVPDGLAYDPIRKIALPQPSFVYRAVLDMVKRDLPRRTLYLAPANNFGTDCYEQEAAAAYLRDYQGKVITVPSSGNAYIDTRGNAAQLRSYAEALNLWPFGPIMLVSGQRHLRRSILCFRKEGFDIEAVLGGSYAIPADEAIVPRLWYYRIPLWHQLYEHLAFLRDLVRLATTKGYTTW